MFSLEATDAIYIPFNEISTKKPQRDQVRATKETEISASENNKQKHKHDVTIDLDVWTEKTNTVIFSFYFMHLIW